MECSFKRLNKLQNAPTLQLKLTGDQQLFSLEANWTAYVFFPGPYNLGTVSLSFDGDDSSDTNLSMSIACGTDSVLYTWRAEMSFSTQTAGSDIVLDVTTITGVDSRKGKVVGKPTIFPGPHHNCD